MIPYRVIKELREKNFPHIERIIWATHPNENGFSTHFPLLEELIEACGEDYKDLYKVGDKWKAESFSGKFTIGNHQREAVAKLWLKLNDI